MNIILRNLPLLTVASVLGCLAIAPASAQTSVTFTLTDYANYSLPNTLQVKSVVLNPDVISLIQGVPTDILVDNVAFTVFNTVGVGTVTASGKTSQVLTINGQSQTLSQSFTDTHVSKEEYSNGTFYYYPSDSLSLGSSNTVTFDLGSNKQLDVMLLGLDPTALSNLNNFNEFGPTTYSSPVQAHFSISDTAPVIAPEPSSLASFLLTGIGLTGLMSLAAWRKRLALSC